MHDKITSTAPLPFEESGYRVLMLGDVMGLGGVNAVAKLLPELRQRWALDLVVVNGENANGFGMIPKSADTLLSAGAHVLTGGNHSLRPSGFQKMLMGSKPVLRPHNLGSTKTPGRGALIVEAGERRVGVINLVGQVYMDPADNPFHAFDQLYEELHTTTDYIIVDFHAEASGEKVAFALHCDGRAALVCGTHTHIPTADERILPGGTGAITDLGLCGSLDSIIGMEPGPIFGKSLHAIPSRLTPARTNIHLQGIVAFLDQNRPICKRILRLDIPA